MEPAPLPTASSSRPGVHIVLRSSLARRASELTFSQRINAFADIFRRSKNRVKNLLRGDLIGEYMLVPGNVMKNTLQNIKHNQNRQGILEEHREQWMQERNMVVKKRGVKKTPRSAGM
jgi:hypothetical protein